MKISCIAAASLGIAAILPVPAVTHAAPTGMIKISVTALKAPAADDMALVRRRLRDSLLPPSGSTIHTAETQLQAMSADGSWPDQDYADTNRERWKAEAHLGRLLTIAKAYYQPQSPWTGREDVRGKIAASLGYWLRVDPRNTNWWHNEIGVPLQVGDLLLLMGNDASPDLLKRGALLMTRAKTGKMTGQNLVWTAEITIMRGCLTGDSDLVTSTYSRMWQEVRWAGPAEEGIQIDASFHQHGPLLYSGGYGAGFTSDVANFEGFAKGTRYALPDEKQAILDAYVLDGQQWMLRDGEWDYGATGRELIRAGKNAEGMVRPVNALAREDGPRQKEMADFAKRLNGDKDAPPLIGNRHYWLSDYMSHQRPGYFASTRMYSSRTLNTDGFINGENKTSHHLADGATYLSLTGQEYVGIYPVWDWHRIPGTTVEQNTPLDPKQVHRMGVMKFVGGVSDGAYGVAAMDLSSDALHARKAWFYFDNEIVCLGAGIACSTANPIFTSMNQSLLSGGVRTSADPAGDLPRGDHSISGARWVWQGNVGYVFPTPVDVHVRNDSQTGSMSLLGPWSPAPITKDVFSLWIDHGAGPKDATYAYVVVPAVTAEQAAAESAKLPLEIVANTPDVQAVWHPGLGIAGVVFHASGESKVGSMTVHVDQPCLVLVRRVGGQMAVSVSNPENAALTVNVRISSTGKFGEHALKFELPGGLEAGKTVTKSFGVND